MDGVIGVLGREADALTIVVFLPWVIEEILISIDIGGDKYTETVTCLSSRMVAK